MAAPSFPRILTVDEYLRSSYRPDVDFVDDHIEKRNLGEYDHARLQTLLAIFFGGLERELGIRVVVEQRVQVSALRYRIPDVSILRRDRPVEQIITHPPLICIEILSPEDTLRKQRDRVSDYQKMGVEHVWILDPATREALICTPTGWNHPSDGKLVVPGTEISIPLADLFSSLDES